MDFKQAVKCWVDEVRDYYGERIGEEGPGGGLEVWGHYTQVCLCFSSCFWV